MKPTFAHVGVDICIPAQSFAPSLITDSCRNSTRLDLLIFISTYFRQSMDWLWNMAEMLFGCISK